MNTPVKYKTYEILLNLYLLLLSQAKENKPLNISKVFRVSLSIEYILVISNNISF